MTLVRKLRVALATKELKILLMKDNEDLLMDLQLWSARANFEFCILIQG